MSGSARRARAAVYSAFPVLLAAVQVNCSAARPPGVRGQEIGERTGGACGNAVVEGRERCDDGNTRGGDGCSPECRAEPRLVLRSGFALLADGSVVCSTRKSCGLPAAARWTRLTASSFVIESARGPRFVSVWDQKLALPRGSTLTAKPAEQSVIGGDCIITDAGEAWCLAFHEPVAVNDGAPKSPIVEPVSRTTLCEAPPNFRALDSHTVAPKYTWCKLQKVTPTRPTMISGGYLFGCVAYGSRGDIRCWRPAEELYWNDIGSAPLHVGNYRVPGLKQLEVSDDGHICALDDQGEVYCWGPGSQGQLGRLGDFYGDDVLFNYAWTIVPKRPVGLPARATKIFTRGSMTCALLVNDELWCWGDTGAQRFADGEPEAWQKRHPFQDPYDSTLPKLPMLMPKDCKPVALDVTERGICTVCESGCVKCWDERTHWRPPPSCMPLP